MNPVFPSSLSNDSVDKFNYKWMVLLLLAVAILAAIIPIHPLFNEKLQPFPNMRPLRLPKVEVTCVRPDHEIEYSVAQTSFMNVYCANAFNEAIQGKKSESAVEMIQQSKRYSLTKHVEYINDYFEKYRRLQRNLDRYVDVKSRVQMLIMWKTPLILVAYAMCLTFPQFAWTFFAEFTSAVNIGKTLENANKDNFYQKVIEGKAFEGSSDTASLLYLLKKFMSIAVVTALLTFTQVYTNAEVNALINDVDASQRSQAEFPRQIDLATFFQSPNDTFSCFYTKFVNSDMNDNKFKQYKSLCTTMETEHIIYSKASVSESILHQKNVLLFGSAVNTAVITLLYTLLFINAISFLSWLYCLVFATRRMSLGLDSATPMDIVLLMQMAKINTGADVVENITEALNEDFKTFHIRSASNLPSVPDFRAGLREGTNGSLEEGVSHLNYTEI